MWSRKTNCLLFSFSFWIAHGSYLSSTYTILSLTQGTASAISNCYRIWFILFRNNCRWAGPHLLSLTHPLSITLSQFYSITHSLSLFLSLSLSYSLSLSLSYSISLSHSLPPSLYVSLTLSLTLPLFLTPFLSQIFLLINQIPSHFSWPHSFVSLWDVFIWQWLREGTFCAELLWLYSACSCFLLLISGALSVIVTDNLFFVRAESFLISLLSG